MHGKWTLVPGVLVCACIAVHAAPAGAPDGPKPPGPVADILKFTGILRGVVVECGSADASLAIEFARLSEMRVYRVDDDPQAVARDRAAVEAAGLSALRVRVEAGPLEAVEYPRYGANIILCSGLPDAKRLQECGRIIRPEGYLFLLPAAGSNGPLGVDEVKRHLAQAGGDGWQEPRACGPAVCVRRAHGPVASERLEAFRRGVQVCEAMLYLQRALDENKIGGELARRVNRVLMDRFYWYVPLRSEWGRGFDAQVYMSNSEALAARLFAACAEVAVATGQK